MGIREGLLALLSQGPRHGYQLKLEFEQATGEVWPVNIGQVYTTLQRLERDRLVVAAEADDEGRVVYQLTADGLATATTWFTTPLDRTVPARDEVTMKLLLAMVAGVVEPRAVIEAQRVATLTALQDYTRLKAEADGTDIAWVLQLERLLMQAEAELRWLDRVEERLAVPAERPSGPGVTGRAGGPPDVGREAGARFGTTRK